MISFKRALKCSVVALALASMAIGIPGTANAHDGSYNTDPNRDGHNGQGAYNSSDRYSGDQNTRGGSYNSDGNTGYHNDRRDYRHYGHRHGDNALSIQFGGIAFGYRDGYWDNGHRWHHWHHHRDYRDHGDHYHGWNHDRDSDNGWQDR